MGLNLLAPIARAMAALRVRRADPQRSARGWFNLGDAGAHVTHDSAEQVAAVWACMDVIASAMSSSDWNVYAGVRNDGDKQDLPDDSLQYILNTRFNPEMSAQAGKRAVALGAVGYGTGYAEIEKDLSGRVVNLWPIAPSRVDPRRDAETGRLFYRVTQEGGGGWVDMDPEYLFIVRGASLVGFAGDDPVARAIKTLSTAIALDQYASGFFSNGAQVGTVFTYKGKLDDTHYERAKKSIEQRHQGAKNAFRPGFFDGAGEWDVKAIGSDAEKSQLVNVKHVSIEEICRWFRVPPHKIAHLLRATNNNIEHQGLEFTRDTLRPWVKEIEQEADYKLVHYRAAKFVEIDVDWAEQGDYKSRAEAYSTLIGCGVFSPNLVLQKLGENTIGKKGDIRFVNGAAIPLDRIGDAYAQSQAKPALPAPEEKQPDATATAWLASVYGRIQRRLDNRAADLERGGHKDWHEQARASTLAYARQQVAEMTGLANMDSAQRWAVEVIDGTDPQIAAVAACVNGGPGVESILLAQICRAQQVGNGEKAGLAAAVRGFADVLANKQMSLEVGAQEINVAPVINVPERQTTVNVEGATIRVEPVNVRVEPVNVTVPERAISVSVAQPNIEVAAPVINVPERAVNVHVEPSVVNVSAPVVNVPERQVNVSVESATVNVAAPVVNVAEREVIVNMAAPIVNVPEQEVIVNVAAPVVNVPAQAAPIVNVAAPVVHVKAQAAEQTGVMKMQIVSMPDRVKSSTVERDRDGRIVETQQTETDA